MKKLTEKKRKQLTQWYLKEMSPTHDSVVICSPENNHCPSCRLPLSGSNRGWGFCRNKSCDMCGKMIRMPGRDLREFTPLNQIPLSILDNLITHLKEIPQNEILALRKGEP